MLKHVYSFLFNYQIIVSVNVLIYDFIAMQMINARVMDKTRCRLSNHTLKLLNDNNKKHFYNQKHDKTVDNISNTTATTTNMYSFMNHFSVNDLNCTDHNNYNNTYDDDDDNNIDDNKNKNHNIKTRSEMPVLSRAKRYLAFPEGSSFTVSVCFTVGIIGNPRNDYMSFGLNWGVAYDLPNSSWILNHLHGVNGLQSNLPNEFHHRRSRRSLYREIEIAIENMGYNGRECILRALCESRQFFPRSKMSMIGEMLRIIFSLPKLRISRRELGENADIEIYDRAFRQAPNVENCAKTYECSFSLLKLAFGQYSTPPTEYYSSNVPFM